MSVTEATAGMVFSSASVTIFDTRTMEWQAYGGKDGARVKPLTYLETGEPAAMLVWLPPGQLMTDDELPYRHIHSTVRERSFVLQGGPLPHWEYDSAEQRDGELILFSAGYFMNRPPGSIHGLEFGPTPPIGRVSLAWRTGTGNWVNEPNAHDENVELPYPQGPGVPGGPMVTAADRKGTVFSRPDVKIYDTREMDWEDWDGLPGGRIKVLTQFDDGTPEDFLLWIPPGPVVAELPTKVYHRTVREFSFVLQGELPVWEDGQPIVLREGFFADRRPGPGGAHGFEPGPVSEVGCVLLTSRTGTGTWPGEAGFAEESVRVT